MTTSAVPIGFGRKRLQYCRRNALTTDTANAATPPMEKGSGVPAHVCARKGTSWPSPNLPTAACFTG